MPENVPTSLGASICEGLVTPLWILSGSLRKSQYHGIGFVIRGPGLNPSGETDWRTGPEKLSKPGKLTFSGLSASTGPYERGRLQLFNPRLDEQSPPVLVDIT